MARKLGLDVSTVSRALNKSPGYERFSETSIHRIEKAALEMGYRPNMSARNMRNGTSHAIGLIFPDGNSRDWFGAPFLTAVNAAVKRHEYHCVIVSHTDGEPAADVAERYFREGRVDGFIVSGMGSVGIATSESLAEKCVPVVHLGTGDKRVSSVYIDDRVGIARALTHLRDLGHRRILYLGYRSAGHGSHETRGKAAVQIAAELGLELWMLKIGQSLGDADEEIERNTAELKRAWKQVTTQTAAVCYNDILAVSLYEVARTGLRIPDDMSVIGFDDIFARFLAPPLTTVSQMFDEQGERAIELLMKQLDGDTQVRRHAVEPELVIRGSTKKLPPR